MTRQQPRDYPTPIVLPPWPSPPRKGGSKSAFEFRNLKNPFYNLLTGRLEEFELRPIRPGQKGYLRTGLETFKSTRVDAGILDSARNIFSEGKKTGANSRTSKGTKTTPNAKLELPSHFSSARNVFDESSQTIWGYRLRR